ncbi:MAG: PAS domain S-box protein, partial [Deltaproteobacteria bacterium]|nr:PAS domain S-box protein [Deltaproteobacteria bacterium]
MQNVRHPNSVISAQSFIWIGIGIGLLYWLLESLMHITVFGEGPFMEHVFTPDVHEIWKRLSVFVLIILFSIYAQRSINIRRRTEAALADREKELSRILENNPAGIMLVDAISRKVSWANSNAIKLIGSSKEHIEDQVCHRHLCPAEVGNCPILDCGQNIDLSERVLLVADGSQLPILKSVARVNYNGKEHLLEAFFDLSDRKKMERDLQQAHAELDQIFQTASVTLRLVDSSFNVLKINNTFERLTGVKEAEAIGKKCHEIFSGPTCFTEQCPIHRIVDGKETVESYVDKERPDGKTIPCILTATPFVGPEGDIIGVVESFRDITELKKAQQAIESERDKLERILSHLHEGVSIINGDCLVEYQNDIFYDYFGACEGQPCFASIHGEQRPCEPCLMQAAVSSGRIQQAEFETADGRSFEKAYTPVTDIDGRKKVVSLWRDVTEKKAATAAIMRAEQLAALGELAAGVAHEINNPINGIINYAQILVNKSEKGDRVHDIASRLIREGDRIARIVEGLLSFARRRHEDKSIISIEEVLSESMALTAAQLRKDNITVKTDLPEHLPDIKAQAHEIEQVFVNIISNARHALNGKFAGPHADKIIQVTAESTTSNGKPFVRVSFKDYGSGIPAAIIDKVMNPFFSTKTEGKRTGLGLSISHGIIEEHGGRLSIESEEGRYTKVVMEL